ncbi:hypothetical protein [Yersinia phage PY54]|uniref:hypothetical protein n=1 Tax=Yersinia phage PY54 TaxID=172667 RepID=UPI00001B9851|nr:hypothetical protein PY54p36 [Yersinia phage PY54]CAD91797.1 hypothetical protein [Yersinia phage PY54]
MSVFIRCPRSLRVIISHRPPIRLTRWATETPRSAACINGLSRCLDFPEPIPARTITGPRSDLIYANTSGVIWGVLNRLYVM